MRRVVVERPDLDEVVVTVEIPKSLTEALPNDPDESGFPGVRQAILENWDGIAYFLAGLVEVTLMLDPVARILAMVALIKSDVIHSFRVLIEADRMYQRGEDPSRVVDFIIKQRPFDPHEYMDNLAEQIGHVPPGPFRDFIEGLDLNDLDGAPDS